MDSSLSTSAPGGNAIRVTGWGVAHGCPGRDLGLKAAQVETQDVELLVGDGAVQGLEDRGEPFFSELGKGVQRAGALLVRHPAEVQHPPRRERSAKGYEAAEVIKDRGADDAILQA
jgi:hypothetical protein